MGDNLVRNAVLNFISRAMIAGVKTNVFTRRGLEFFSREAILEAKEIIYRKSELGERVIKHVKDEDNFMDIAKTEFVIFEPQEVPACNEEIAACVVSTVNEQTHPLMIQKEMLTIAGPRKELVSCEHLPLATVFEWFNKFLDVGRYEQWKHSQWPTTLSFLEEFSSLSIPAEALIYNLPLMEPRFYSVSVCRAHQPVWIL